LTEGREEDDPLHDFQMAKKSPSPTESYRIFGSLVCESTQWMTSGDIAMIAQNDSQWTYWFIYGHASRHMHFPVPSLC